MKVETYIQNFQDAEAEPVDDPGSMLPLSPTIYMFDMLGRIFPIKVSDQKRRANMVTRNAPYLRQTRGPTSTVFYTRLRRNKKGALLGL